jgi:hypothetical protein
MFYSDKGQWLFAARICVINKSDEVDRSIIAIKLLVLIEKYVLLLGSKYFLQHSVPKHIFQPFRTLLDFYTKNA